jgi:branched-chain amino acid transport system ATP-binding protein
MRDRHQRRGKSTLDQRAVGEIAASAARDAARHDVTRWTQPRRARAGLGRSYQRTTIFPRFTVLENCRLAAQAHHQRPLALWPRRSLRRDAARSRTTHGRTGLPIGGRARRHAAHGQKRQLEIAMCLATASAGAAARRAARRHGPEETERMLALLAALKPATRSCWSSTTWTRCSASPTASP